MITINTISDKYFALDGIQFARIYQPLKQGLENVGIYSIYDTRKQLVNSTRYDEFTVNGSTFASQADAIEAILEVVYNAAYSAYVFDLEDRIENLEENQYSGVVVYSTYAELPTTGTLLVSYKVSNDTDTSKNGYYHWSGSVYIKDADLVNGIIEENNPDAISGGTVFDYVKQTRLQDGYDVFNDFDLSSSAIGFSLNEETLTYSVDNGTSNVVNVYLRGYLNCLDVINKAVENGLSSLFVDFSFASTINVGVLVNVISDQRTVNLSVGTFASGTKNRYELLINSGEVFSEIKVLFRFPVTTATEYLTLKINYLKAFTDDSVFNSQLRDKYDAELIDKSKLNPTVFTDVLVRHSDYDVGCKPHTWGVQVYRGIRLNDATAIAANANMSAFLNDSLSYMNGKSLTIKMIFECNVEISTVLNASFTSLGNDLYSYEKTITDFDSGNSSKIYNYIQCKTTTTTAETIITLVDVYVVPQDKETYEAALNRYENTRFNPVKIFIDTSNNVYYTNYTDLVTVCHSLLDGTEFINYDVIVGEGEYDLTSMFDYDNITDQTPYERGLELPPYVNLISEANAVLNCKYVYGDARMDQAKYQAISALNCLGNNKIENIKVVAENCRYAFHDDGNTEDEPYLLMDNVHLEHLGNVVDIAYQVTDAYGSGYGSGKRAVFNKCYFKGNRGIRVHNSLNMSKPANIEINNCVVLENKSGYSMVFDSTSVNDTVNVVSINNCQLNGKLFVENSPSDKNWQITGAGNTRIPYESQSGDFLFIPAFSDEDINCKNVDTSIIAAYVPVKLNDGGFKEFQPTDNILLFSGISLEAIAIGVYGTIKRYGYIEAALLGLSVVIGDTLCLDSGVFVKNGVNVIGVCDYDGYCKIL